ncbi:MAG: DegT/DnrJ/EryC1/StrS family aminotransferase [Deltaproteobacteria bacterium]|nr:DegT/DnrJ/EryC1/StrS family aminotransferase [Deltaproteobacteria bacterium]
MDTIPVNEPLLDGNEKKYLCECIDSGWISSEGPFVRELEERFAARVGRRHGIALCNGSAALEVAVASLGLGAGDEVILPAFTIISCAAAVVRAGAVPVLVDCDAATWNMDPDRIKDRITGRTKAVMAVHTYGLPVDMAPLQALADKYGLYVIEDAAEAHGLTCRGLPCGSFGNISTFSFYPNKLVTTGEGGMVLTDDETLAERCRSRRNLCFQSGRRFYHEELGWNYRLSNLQAAVGLAQLERIEAFIDRKRRMGHRYRTLLEDIPGLQQPLAATDWAENIYWVYGLCLKDDVPFDAAGAMKRLGERGIGTRPFFWPIHEQPVFKHQGMFAGESHPISERLARRGFYIPSGLALTDAQMDRVAAALHEVMA